MDIKLLFLITVLIIVAAAVVYFFYNTYLKKQDEKSESRQVSGQQETEFDAELRYEYSSALRSGDKEKALALGKKYYQNLLGERYTDDIEQIISDELSTIKKV
ncbi:MAG: hypothetical protein ABR503_04055 [Chitinophagaceae bacterium]